MKLERSDINFPVWRKKVDSSLLRNDLTPIPNWVLKIWDIEKLFNQSISKKNPEAVVEIVFQKKIYRGFITKSRTPTRSAFYRLFLEKKLGDALKATYLMSYVRSIEAGLTKKEELDANEKIPFWEFLDIEFDSTKRIFLFTAHYVHPPMFPNVFKNLARTHILNQIETESSGFFTSNWISKKELRQQIEVVNIIYYLIDSKNKTLYIGEAENLKRRFDQGHPIIPNWDYYRYDILPFEFSKKQRVALEKMLIRCFATLLGNTKAIPTLLISDYRLANSKVKRN